MSCCQACNSDRVVEVYGKTSDMCVITINRSQFDGYVPYDMNIGGGDDINFDMCLNCGQIQGTFPLPVSDYEQQAAED